MSTSPQATVVVCTRNRSTVLVDTCESALEQELPGRPWELLVVDNGSTDDTLELVRALEREHPDRMRVIQESEVGLSAARNAGIDAARGEVIAFLDDDALPEPGWLEALWDALSEEGVLAAGGPVEPLFEEKLPAWFTERYLPYLTVWDLGRSPVALTYNEYPRGANIAFHREAFERFGDFSTRFGRKGRSLLSCEEIEICLRIERAGGRILYVPGAKVRHRVWAGRLTPRWLALRFAAQGESEARIDYRHGGLRGLRVGLLRFGRNAVGAVREISRDPGSRLFARCQLAALRGYLRGLVSAPWIVPRYRPPGGDEAEWVPRL